MYMFSEKDLNVFRETRTCFFHYQFHISRKKMTDKKGRVKDARSFFTILFLSSEHPEPGFTLILRIFRVIS